MSEALPANLVIISETGANLVPILKETGIRAGHFTNGTYAPPAGLIVPTVLAAFQYAVDTDGNEDTPLIIAVNSDISMAAIMDEKIAKGTASQTDKDSLENQYARAQKVGIPLAQLNPERTVAVIFYDEGTPNALYGLLDDSGFRMKTLFKWGYGTDPKAGVIEGAEHFEKVNAHPLPNDIKPVCTELTRMTGQKGDLDVVDLRTALNPKGNPYLVTGKAGALLFLVLAWNTMLHKMGGVITSSPVKPAFVLAAEAPLPRNLNLVPAFTVG